ncbi:hypothetical protein JTB14_012616 [Gonioctena quinquepunctata]|nr:hypothetical protein JTB14_012616 [Gonioctena quinquepunctata]
MEIPDAQPHLYPTLIQLDEPSDSEGPFYKIILSTCPKENSITLTKTITPRNPKTKEKIKANANTLANTMRQPKHLKCRRKISKNTY